MAELDKAWLIQAVSDELIESLSDADVIEFFGARKSLVVSLAHRARAAAALARRFVGRLPSIIKQGLADDGSVSISGFATFKRSNSIDNEAAGKPDGKMYPCDEYEGRVLDAGQVEKAEYTAFVTEDQAAQNYIGEPLVGHWGELNAPYFKPYLAASYIGIEALWIFERQFSYTVRVNYPDGSFRDGVKRHVLNFLVRAIHHQDGSTDVIDENTTAEIVQSAGQFLLSRDMWFSAKSKVNWVSVDEMQGGLTGLDVVATYPKIKDVWFGDPSGTQNQSGLSYWSKVRWFSARQWDKKYKNSRAAMLQAGWSVPPLPEPLNDKSRACCKFSKSTKDFLNDYS